MPRLPSLLLTLALLLSVACSIDDDPAVVGRGASGPSTSSGASAGQSTTVDGGSSTGGGGNSQPDGGIGAGTEGGAGPDGGEVTYVFTLTTPADGSQHSVGTPVLFAGTTNCVPSTVELLADGQYPIGSVQTSNGSFSHEYTFNTAGPARVVSVTATGPSCTAEASVTLAITAAQPPNPLDVPYFCQYQNSLYPGSSCQNTSIAMVLAYYGWGGHPDDITAAWGKDYAQSPSGLAHVFNSYSGPLAVALTAHTNGTFAGLRSMLAAGKPVIVHGYFTQYGHVVVTVGHDASGYWVNDPAGVWNQAYQGGYSPKYCDWGYSGDTVYYAKAAFESAIGPDGTLWYHEPSRP